MAILKAPLLSFGASGKIADTLVHFTWKGLNVVREHVIPANPRTAAQQTQRGYWGAAVSAWRTYYIETDMRQAWNRHATAKGKKDTGYNQALSAMIGMAPAKADASFSTTSFPYAGHGIWFVLLNMDDGADADETGNFEVWVGYTASSLHFFEYKALDVPFIKTSALGKTEDVKYAQLRKDGQSRSGIVKHTLL